MPLHVSSIMNTMSTVNGTATYRCGDTRGCLIQFWPPDDEHMVLEICRGTK